MKEAVDDVLSKEGNSRLSAEDVKVTVAKAVKEAVRERVAEMLNETEETA